MNDKLTDNVSFHDIFWFYFRHQFKILAIFFVTTATLTALVYYFPEKYDVYIKVLVKLGREDASISPTVSSPILVFFSIGVITITKTDSQLEPGGRIPPGHLNP